MSNMKLYRISENYSKYLYEENNKVLKSFDNKGIRPFVRNYISNK